jgi:hypothetical protein
MIGPSPWLPWFSLSFCSAVANRRSTAAQNSPRSAPSRKIDCRLPEISITTNARQSILHLHMASREDISGKRPWGIEVFGQDFAPQLVRLPLRLSCHQRLAKRLVIEHDKEGIQPRCLDPEVHLLFTLFYLNLGADPP